MLSPDGKYMLITREHRPFSYLHPAREFPKEVEIWRPTGATAAHKSPAFRCRRACRSAA